MKIDVAFEDIQVGDLVTLSYEGHEFSGEAWEEFSGVLWVGADPLQAYDGTEVGLKFVSAIRELKLPTGIGANVLAQGTRFTRFAHADRRRDEKYTWVSEDGQRVEESVLEGLLTSRSFEILSEGVEIE